MTDRSNDLHSDQMGANYTGHDEKFQKDLDNEVHRVRQEDEQQAGSIPREAGNDFTFPDEEQTLGRKVGDDLPDEPSSNRD